MKAPLNEARKVFRRGGVKASFYLFIHFWLCWVFVAACGLSLVAVSGSYSSLRSAGFSLRWLLVAEHGL